MNLSLFAGATGMHAQQMNLNTIANNIANVNTAGFKRNKIEFEDLIYQNPQPSGGEVGGGNQLPAGIEMGNGTRVASTAKVFTQGQLTQTGEQLDVAIEGGGFFEVLMPDGTLAYTRDGALKRDSNGQVVTNDGFPLQGGWQTIPSDATGISISDTGFVTVSTANGETSFRVQLARFAYPSGLKSMGNNLYTETPASGTAEAGNPGEAGFGTLRQQFLELSNVNVVEEMVNMIIAQRAYEINSKAIQSSDDMLSRINQLKR